jgi:hypothetical protein
VEAEFCGLIDWSAEDVCHYHYFEHEISEKSEDQGQNKQHTYDGSKPFGHRNKVVTHSVKTILHSRISDRHTHHVVDCKLYDLSSYPSKVPQNVGNFLDSVPAWLRPLLKIVDGTITMEERVRVKFEENTRTEEKMSVSEYSPAVLLGDVTLIGWSGADLRKAAPVSYQWQPKPMEVQNRKEVSGNPSVPVDNAIATTKEGVKLRRWASVSCIILACLFVLFAVGMGIQQYNAAKTEYQVYVNAHSVGSVTTKTNELLNLPGNTEWEYGGDNSATGENIFFTNVNQTVRVTSSLPKSKTIGGSLYQRYGDVSLSPGVGIEAVLHVLSVDSNSIRYTVTLAATPPSSVVP